MTDVSLRSSKAKKLKIAQSTKHVKYLTDNMIGGGKTDKNKY